MSKELFRQKTKDDIHEILMNLNRGRLAVSQAHEQIFNILEQPSEADSKESLASKIERIFKNVQRIHGKSNSLDWIKIASIRSAGNILGLDRTATLGGGISDGFEPGSLNNPLPNDYVKSDYTGSNIQSQTTDHLPDIRKVIEPTKTAEIDSLAEAIDRSGRKITFGIQDWQIKRIEEERERWNKIDIGSLDVKVDMIYSYHFWKQLAEEFAWEPCSLALHYFEAMEEYRNQGVPSEEGKWIILHSNRVLHGLYFNSLERARNYVKMQFSNRVFKEIQENVFADTRYGSTFKIVQLRCKMGNQ